MANLQPVCHTCAHLLRQGNRCPIIGRYVEVRHCACEGKHYRPANPMGVLTQQQSELLDRLHVLRSNR